MSGSHAFSSAPGTGFAVNDGPQCVLARPSPTQNVLLAALSQQEYRGLAADLEPCPLPAGWTFHDAGDRDSFLYFVTSGIVSRFNVTASGASAEFALTGNEGVIGIATFLGGGSTTSRAVVLSPGHSFRMRADRLQHEFEHDGPLPRLLLRYTHSLIVQIGLISACARHHALEQRLCRWLLSWMDRSRAREMTLTHQLVADVLGVRREGVTEAVGALQAAGLIHSSRGHMVMLDRLGLEARVCECHSLIKREHDGLLADYRQARAPSWGRTLTGFHGFPQRDELCEQA